MCASAGTVLFKNAARAPWQQGKVERHGGLIKEIMEKSREEMPASTMDELIHILQACECANEKALKSLTQRQIGQWPRVPSDLLSDEAIDPALQSQNRQDDFEKLMEMRRIAQNAFMKVASQDAAARALTARPRVQRQMNLGDIVYLYRVLKAKKTLHHSQATSSTPEKHSNKARWVGPGHVLATEGSVVWINNLGELWRAAIEQVRLATSDEKRGVEVINEKGSEMQERRFSEQVEEIDGGYTPTSPAEDIAQTEQAAAAATAEQAEEEIPRESGGGHRQVSIRTEGEPEGEAVAPGTPMGRSNMIGPAVQPCCRRQKKPEATLQSKNR